MNPWYALAMLGFLLAVAGLFIIFRVKGDGDNTFKVPGIEIKSKSTGAFVLALGVALAFWGIKEGSQRETRVTAARLMTDTGQASAEYYVLCPVNVRLVGEISVSGDPGVVSYRLDRQEGLDGPVSSGPVQAVAFDAPGTQPVSFNIPVTIPEGVVNFTSRLVVLDPTSMESNAVPVSVTCDPTLPPGPPTPPPDVTPPQ